MPPVTPSGRFTGCRTRYTNADKVNILSVVHRLQTEQCFSLTLAAQFILIIPPVICRFAKKAQELQCGSKKAGKMSFHAGPTSLVDDIEEELLNFINKWRQKGFKVNRFTLL